MIVAIASVQWEQVDSLLTLLGLEEILFFALFLWLAIDGPGDYSLDRLLQARSP
jgi:putative oxidoreductase